MTRVPDSKHTERKGIVFIERTCNEMRYAWRETTHTDVGFDGEIEIVVGGIAMGQIIKVQSRSGKSYIQNEKDDCFDFYGDAAELEYWTHATNPVILIVYNPEADIGYWLNIKNYCTSHPEISKRPHKLRFSKSGDVFGPNSAKALAEIFHPYPAKAEQNYRQHVIDRYGKLTLYSVYSDAPIAVDLERVFVKLTTIRPRTLSESERETTGRYKPTLSSASLQGGQIAADAVSSTSFNEALKLSSSLTILGAPGAGKTTLLKYIALTFARDVAKERLNLDEVRLPIVVALRDFNRYLDNLEKVGAFLEAGSLYVVRFLNEHLKAVASHLNLPSYFFQSALAGSRCIVLLDGLDEVAEPSKRARVAEIVAAFLNDYRGNRFIITSRPRGYEGEARQRLSSFCVECSIRDFDEEDISKFTHSWYEAVTRDRLGDNPDSIAVAKSKSDDLLEAIQDDERVAKLAANPLLLSVLAMVHQRGVGLPHRRAELYDECTDLLLGYWDQTKGGDAARELATYGQLSRSEKRALLEPIALWFHQRREEKTEADEKELQAEIAQQFQQTFGDSGQVALRRAQLFLQIIEERAGLLVERARGIYAFAHLTFQEYLTARAVADREDYISFTLRHLHDPWWLEVILLEVGHLSGTHHAARRARRLTTDLIKAIAEAGSMYENILRRDLVLACRCLCDTGTLGVEDNLRFRLFDELLSHWRELASNHRQWEIDEILDYAAATPAGLRICERLIQYSNDGDANVRLSVAACLGLIGASLVSNDLVKCLLKLTNDSSVIVRTNAIEALGGLKEIGFRDAIVNKMKELSSSSDPRVRSACAQAWGGIARVAPDEATEHLLKLTADEIRDVREAAEMGWDSAPASVVRQASTAVMEIVKQKERAEELLSGLIVIVGIPNAYLDAIGVKRLIALSKHQDAQVRSLVAEILSRIDDERVEAQLLALTRDSDASVRVSALGSVAFKERKYDSNGVVEALLRSAIDPNPGVRAVAATAFPLMEPFQEKLAASFSAMCRDKDKRVRAAAAQNLGRRAEDLRSRFVVSKLMALSSDEELSVRQAAAYGLAEVGDQIDDPNIINHLIVTLRRLDKDRRTSILYSLSRLASGPLRKGVIHALLKLTADGDPEIRAAGVTAFQFSTGIGTPPVISRLRDLLGDEAARLPAIYALERIGRSARQPSVIEQISNFLKHSDIKVRMAAAEALLGIQ